VLNIKKDALAELEKQKAEAAKLQMAAKIKAEEERQIARRAKQEKHLAEKVARKNILAAAQGAEEELKYCCSELEAVNEARSQAKKKIQRENEAVKLMRHEVAKALKAVEKSEQQRDLALGRLRNAEQFLQETKAATDDSIIEQRSQNLREAWDNSRAAWDRVNKAVKKKQQDRALKKRAKGLLGL
jgi:hypothetical protein